MSHLSGALLSDFNRNMLIARAVIFLQNAVLTMQLFYEGVFSKVSDRTSCLPWDGL